MKSKNGTTQDVSGRRKNSQRKNESERLGKHGENSPIEGTDQIGNAAINSTREDTTWPDSQRNPNSGKILERLELIETTFLSYVHGHQQRLETRLDESKKVEEEFRKEAAELRSEILALASKSEEPEIDVK